MSCQQARDLVHAHLDRELDLASTLEMEQHLRECATCTESYEEGRRLRTLFAEEDLYVRAPRELREAVRHRPRPLRLQAMSFGLPVALAAMIAFCVVTLLKPPAMTDSLADEIVSAHVRSLMADHLTDVASSDKHTVKPWFDGKLDFAPVVVDLADHGFPLVGGRLDYLGGRPAAALVYGRQKHFINLFVRPSSSNDGNVSPGATRHGFNWVHWNSADASYWAISDLNSAELEDFAGLIRERTSAAAR